MIPQMMDTSFIILSKMIATKAPVSAIVTLNFGTLVQNNVSLLDLAQKIEFKLNKSF